MKTEEISHSEQQAMAQMESIKEMVAALNIKTAADEWVKGLTREQCVKILTEEAGIQCYDHEDVDELQEAVASNIEDKTVEPEGFEFDEEEARERIHEDPLEISVRTDWHPIGAEDNKPTHYRILLCTGGPACCIEGGLSIHQEPENARMLHQDWGTPWMEYFKADRDVLLEYARQFYFGE